MSCNCKNDKAKPVIGNDDLKPNTKFRNYVLNFVFYLIALSISSIIIIPVMVVLLFKIIVLNNNTINIPELIIKYYNNKKNINKEDTQDDEDEILEFENANEILEVK